MLSYKPLFKLLIELELNLTELENISSATLAKLKKNQYISLKTIERIHKYLSLKANRSIKLEEIFVFKL